MDASLRIDAARTKRDSSSSSGQSSIRTHRLEMEDRQLARAIKRISKLSTEIRMIDDAEGQGKALRDRIDMARKSAALNIAQLNEKMDEIEQSWDVQIMVEQEALAKEVIGILKDLKEEGLSDDLKFSKRTSTTSRSSQSQSSLRSGSSTLSSNFSRKIAHLEEREGEFAAKSKHVRRDARQIKEMGVTLDSLSELERVVCARLARLQTSGEVKPRGAVYGTVELVDTYRLAVEHLANAIRSLTAVSCLPEITKDDPITKTEIEKICHSMTDFLGRIQAQLPGQTSAKTPLRPQTRVKIASRNSAPSTSPYPASQTGASSASSYASAKDSDTSFAASTAHSIISYK